MNNYLVQALNAEKSLPRPGEYNVKDFKRLVRDDELLSKWLEDADENSTVIIAF